MRSFRQRQNKRIVASVPDPMRERGVNTQFPIHDLIESQQKRLGLRRSDLALRIGFKNVAKGLRRIDGVCHGDLDSPGAKMALDNLAVAHEKDVRQLVADGLNLVYQEIRLI